MTFWPRPMKLETDTLQNLVARGEHQKPAAGGAMTEGYDAANHNVLGHTLDPAGEGATDFAYPGGNPGTTDY